jgi:hypothetical protein
MAGDVDVVIQGNGINSFRPFGQSDADLDAYNRVVKNNKLSRTLLSISCGADEDLDANKNELLKEIDKATGGQTSRLGGVCLFGDSNSCGLILLVAKALQDRGAPKPLYVGVADVTMMPFGRRPTLPGIGDLQPVNKPPVAFGLKIFVPGVALATVLPPSVKDGPPPRINNPGIVADKLDNFFTVEGNRARVFSRSPAGADDWWWTSTMNFGEVHGELTGWNNIRLPTTSTGTILSRGPGSVDDGHHNDLCGQAMRRMKGEVSVAMVKFVTSLKP